MHTCEMAGGEAKEGEEEAACRLCLLTHSLCCWMVSGGVVVLVDVLKKNSGLTPLLWVV